MYIYVNEYHVFVAIIVLGLFGLFLTTLHSRGQTLIWNLLSLIILLLTQNEPVVISFAMALLNITSMLLYICYVVIRGEQ